MSRTRHRITLVAAAGMLGLALTACGGEQEADSTSTPPATSAPAAASAESPTTTVSENSSASVVGGPKPAKPTTVVPDHHDGQKACGTVPGPDGALRVLLLAGDLECTAAKEVASDYAPKIATGQRQSVRDWTCGPSEVEGLLAACQKDNSVIGFAP